MDYFITYITIQSHFYYVSDNSSSSNNGVKVWDAGGVKVWDAAGLFVCAAVIVVENFFLLFENV